MTEGFIEWRTVAVLVCASAAFTALCPAIYQRDPARRKLFLAALSAALLLAPWWSTAGLWTWPLIIRDVGLGSLGRPVPWLLIAVWWTVGALLIARTVFRVCRGRHDLAALPPLADPAAEWACRRWSAALGVSRPVSLKLGAVPCASSLGRPMLVLPAAAGSWEEATRSAVLCHELAHLKRADDRLVLLVRLLTDWYWWMPWLRRVQRRYVEAMEESCDDLASAALGSRTDYVAGVVRAARSISEPAGAAASSGWTALLGHSHLAARVQRLVTVPGPTLRHADGRWALFWASIAFAVALTAEPAAVPAALPQSAELLPLTPADTVEGAHPQYRPPRVETASYLQNPRTGAWHAVPGSARDPLPVYPAAALAQRLQGQVTVEMRLRTTRFGVTAAASPAVSSSSDSSGLLQSAVERALARTGISGFGAGLRAAGTYKSAAGAHKDAAGAHKTSITPPPGNHLRLRKIYRFVLGTPASQGAHSTD